MGYFIINKGTSEGTVRLADGNFMVMSAGEKVQVSDRPISVTTNIRVVPITKKEITGSKDAKGVSNG
jgi:hypothetical protein